VTTADAFVGDNTHSYPILHGMYSCVIRQENMANKVKMLEEKLSGGSHPQPDEHNVHQPLVPRGKAPYGLPNADHPTASRPMTGADDETSFNNKPPTKDSLHGARPKTSKADDDDTERPDVRRSSMALPYIAE